MAIRSPMSLLQPPLVRQKGLALHEKQGKRRKPDIRHRVVQLRIRAAPCIRKISANRPQSRQKRLEDLHTSTKHSSLRWKIAITVPRPFRTAGGRDRELTSSTVLDIVEEV